MSIFKVPGVVVCIAVASTVYAQSSDAKATSSATTTAQTRSTSTKRTDRKLGLDVRRALGKASGMDTSNVFGRARAGAITLTGSVRYSDQIVNAGDVAKRVSGVTSVSNKLVLSQQGGL
ncbi:BON domain-containing protein [Burkholderia sp. CF099]|nr:BON domain-containing protein [Burkholderia sp. CF099]